MAHRHKLAAAAGRCGAPRPNALAARRASRAALPRPRAYLPASAPTAAAADTAAAFKRLQNGSDIRGVALKGERRLGRRGV
ncbi:hypothetical protein MNEG_14685 [Monoraphidium neglectum]|uniref:Uncharacterized protein n=1 Tax=Monoraphidium neglectum TaxID=145388 RepID=A0A0D2KBE0_9CHLO|nr:hypothetical protein MNEG_14685 [Monoraphidium neglectum]KIY93278.1 hypothetical protein MNEG_14685 [Monoraphidium neglectum]|eukprot:XP_013892298.1 hypothetical protein MNEG_14685 [Monoraphidium neglectum]